MWTTNNQVEMTEQLKTFVRSSHAHYGEYAYAAGFMESMITQMLPHMPKRVQKDFIADVQRANNRILVRQLEALQEDQIFD